LRSLLAKDLVLEHVVLFVESLEIVHVLVVENFGLGFGKLASVAHDSEGEVQIFALHADPVPLSLSELSLLLVVACSRLHRDSIYHILLCLLLEEVAIERLVAVRDGDVVEVLWEAELEISISVIRVRVEPIHVESIHVISCVHHLLLLLVLELIVHRLGDLLLLFEAMIVIVSVVIEVIVVIADVDVICVVIDLDLRLVIQIGVNSAVLPR